MRRFGRYLIAVFAIIGLCVVLLMGGGIWAAAKWRQAAEPALPKQMILTMDLEAEFHETDTTEPLAALSDKLVYSIRDVTTGLSRAAKDQRVAAIFATLGHTSLDMAQIQEIRDAVLEFRKSGKPAVLFAETIGEFGAGSSAYYLASAFDRIWLQPSGDVGLTGYSIESPFVKGSLDLLGVAAQFSGRKEYKSAIETFTETGYTAAHKESIEALLDSWTAQTIAGIAQGRHMGEDKAGALFGKGPFGAAESLSAGLVDKLGYYNEAWADAGGDDQKNHEIDLGDYASRLPAEDGPHIAVISGIGPITRGGGGGNPLGGDETFAAGIVAEAFRDAVDDSKVKAILFRVNSPGGSYVASDVIRNEVARARAAGKPVVVTMSGAAASGGYFVSMDADSIIAQPATITGSIGVFSGKMVLKDFWPKIGISWDGVKRGENADMFSANSAFSPSAWDRMNAMLDRIYDDFTHKAAKGRNIAPERMEELAKGRVWSGADAQSRGLVDKLGGWMIAQAEIRSLLKLAPDAPLTLVDYPAAKTPWEYFADLANGGIRETQSLRSLVQAAQILEPVLRQLAPRADAGGPVLRMPEIKP